jgi:uncharacterized membrane protein
MGSPLILISLLTVWSGVITALNWHKTPEKVPVWWDLQAHPLLWAPKWFGLLVLPVLTLLVPYVVYQVSVNDRRLQGHGGQSKHAVAHIIELPAWFFFFVQAFILLPAVTSVDNDFGARLFAATVAVWLLFYYGLIVRSVEPNNYIGLGMPWTTTDVVWVRTQYQGGNILMVSGILLLILSWVVPLGLYLLSCLLIFWFGPFLAIFLLAYYYSLKPTSEPLLLK